MRFTRLKKQIENWSSNSDLRPVLQPKIYKERKNNCTKKAEENANNNLSIGTGEQHPQRNGTTTRPGNININLADSFDYGIPLETDKKYESDGSLYVADKADSETDDDIPLTKRRRTNRETSILKRGPSIKQYAARHKLREERTSKSLEFRRDQNQPPQTIELISDDEDEEQALSLRKKTVPVVGTLSGTHNLARGTMKGQRLVLNDGSNWPIESTKGKNIVTATSVAMSPGIVTSSIAQNDVIKGRQINHAHTAYPSLGPSLSSFRSRHIDNQDQGPTLRYSGSVTGIELGSVNGLTVPKPLLSLRRTPGADDKREGFMTWRETAIRAKGLQKNRSISETKDVNIEGTVTGQSISGRQGAQREQLEVEEPAKSQAPYQKTRSQISPIVIDLD